MVFQNLAQNNVNISAIAQGPSELNISMVMSRADEELALNAVHTAFFMPGFKTLNLFLVGAGADVTVAEVFADVLRTTNYLV